MIEKKQNQKEGNADWSVSVDLFYLVSCVFHDVIPEKKRIGQMDLSSLYHMAQFHLLSAITCMALETAGVFAADSPQMAEEPMQQLAKKWGDKKNKAVRKVILLDAERGELCSLMEQAGIWYLPLKGILLKECYPKVGMRQMADNDILYDSQYQWKLKELMEKRGFNTVSVGKGNHDVYEKKPIYNFEMHTALYGNGHDKDWVSYYQDVKERLIQNDGAEYGYHFSDEDFYVYMITHAYKHYNGSGTGIRSLLDVYAYLLKKEYSLDWDYIFGELKKLRVEDFEAESRVLAKKLFSQELCELTIEESRLLGYFFGSGIYGTMKNRVEKRLQGYQRDGGAIKKETKKKYFMKRLFPDEEWYQNYAPFAYHHKWCRPFFLLFRIVRGLLRKRREIAREVKIVVKIKE